jgi:hypothetical protein
MKILFESDTEQEQEFEYDGQIIINKGTVQIVEYTPTGEIPFINDDTKEL